MRFYIVTLPNRIPLRNIKTQRCIGSLVVALALFTIRKIHEPNREKNISLPVINSESHDSSNRTPDQPHKPLFHFGLDEFTGKQGTVGIASAFINVGQNIERSVQIHETSIIWMSLSIPLSSVTICFIINF